MLGMIWNYEFFSKEGYLQSKNEQTFDEVCFDLTEKFLNSQNSVHTVQFERMKSLDSPKKYVIKITF